ncbi:MAG: HAMP domain-containing histidine kinase [Bacteroides sp.]|nr:HAMP domain-containing histidine kinase [Bacteroides sp.]
MHFCRRSNGKWATIRTAIPRSRIAHTREDFSHAMIHDMKSPINIIVVGLNMLHSEKLFDKPEKRDNYFRIASEECQRLLSPADKILILARLEQDSLILHKQQILLKPIVGDLAEKSASKAGKPVQFEIRVNSEDIVYADGEYLKEAISNRIENAIKYSGESVRIDIKRTVHEGHDHISIQDNGFGIPFKDQKKIFNKFERASAAGRKDRAKGLRLGLNYVHNVVLAHGGHVILRSIEGEYSEFILVLPRHKTL